MNHALKKLLAALVACLMLLSSVAALAAGRVYVFGTDQVTVDEDVTSTESRYAVYADGNGSATVNGNVSNSVNKGYGIVTFDNGVVTVNGSVTGEGNVQSAVRANNNSIVTVGDDVNGTWYYGVEAFNNSSVEVQGNVTSQSDAVYTRDNPVVKVGGDATSTDGTAAYASGGGTIEIGGDATSTNGSAAYASGGTIEIGGDATSTNGSAAFAYGGTIEIGGDATGKTAGVNAKGGATVTVDGVATASGDQGNGVDAQGKDTAVTVGGATASGDSGNGVSAGDSATVTVNGDVTSSGSSGSGVLAYDGATVTVAGNAEGVSDGAYASNGSTVTVAGNAEGVYDGAYATGHGSKVTVLGNAIATGDSGTGAMAFDGGTVTVVGNAEGAEGVYAYGDGAKVTVGHDAIGDDTGASVGRGSSVLVEGTIAGSSAGVNIRCQDPEDLDDISVTAWKIDGDIQYNGSTDFDQSIGDKITQKVISYIIRVAEASGNVLNPDVVEGTDNVSDFKVAHEAEEVSAKLAGYNKGDKLEVYYNEDTKLSAGDYKVENGTLIVKMLPGGAMNLIAKIIKAEEKAKKTTKKAATEFVYVPVDDNTAMNGVKAADHSGMADAVKAMGDSLGGEDVTVDILDKEKLMNGEELARFDKLSVKDRLLVVLKALGFGEALGGIEDEMSDEAAALSDDIAARVDALSDAEKQTLQDRLYSRFLPRLIVIDGQEYEAVGIEVVVTRDGVKSQARYTFYKDNGEWKLHQIEKGEYRAVNA